MSEPHNKPADGVILSVEDLSVHFSVGGGLFGGGARLLRAVEGVNLQLKRGECLGLVGESGSGKSTVALSILGLQAPTHGRIVLHGMLTANQQSLAQIWPFLWERKQHLLELEKGVRRLPQ